MDNDTLLEVIKALSFGVDIETIANMAEVEPEEIEKISKKYENEIKERQKNGGDFS